MLFHREAGNIDFILYKGGLNLCKQIYIYTPTGTEANASDIKRKMQHTGYARPKADFHNSIITLSQFCKATRLTKKKKTAANLKKKKGGKTYDNVETSAVSRILFFSMNKPLFCRKLELHKVSTSFAC